MIVLFHLFAAVLSKLVWNLKKTPICNLTSPLLHLRPYAEKDLENEIKFDPPAYKQRYERVTEILESPHYRSHISKLVDFGCAEFGFFVFLKHSTQIRELYFVDVDEPLIRDYLHRVYPLNADYLVRRQQQLIVKVFAGSLSDPDPALLHTDAVVALETIEHLYPDVLEAFPYNVFHYIHPKIVIVTTPNKEFNVLFKKMNVFRHYDHKFEWTREQFRSWATNITKRFPSYDVQFDGIGLGPPGTEHLGCCSQMAVFIRKDICDIYQSEHDSTWSPKTSFGICTYYSFSKKSQHCHIWEEQTDYISEEQSDYYQLLATVQYPQHVDTRTEEEKFLDELKYRINCFSVVDGEFYNSDKDCFEIPLRAITFEAAQPLPSEHELRNLLLKFNYKIKECRNQETDQQEDVLICKLEMDSSSASENETGPSGYESDKCIPNEGQVSDWDDDLVSWDFPCATDSTEPTKSQLNLEVKSEDVLMDSGYQKSPLAVEDSLPCLPLTESIPLEHKSIDKPNKLSNTLSVFDDFDKINELDAIHKEKRNFHYGSNLPPREVMKKICQEIAKHPIAGPSRERNVTTVKRACQSDSDDSVDEVKTAATCILENSLNKIEDPPVQIIQGYVLEGLEGRQEVAEPVLIVENGDLANNNRDGEGNNYEPPQDEEAFDNLIIDNINIGNNNEVDDPVPEDIVLELVEEIIENAENPPVEELEVAWSSREALYDVNSQVDLLEDFEIEPDVPAGFNVSSDFVAIVNDCNIANGVLPADDAVFPNWLLQIFEEGEMLPFEDELHDEPHYYCQGDGLGVHPSITAINDDDDDGNESDTSSSTDSVDLANVENRHEEPALAVLGEAVVLNQNDSHASLQQEAFGNAENCDTRP